VQLDAGRWSGTPKRTLEQAVRATCRALGVEEAEISVALVDDPHIAALARTHLGKDEPTDVLAFALYQKGEPVLGDVYVGAEQAERQASAAGVSLEEELVRLVVHGTLHVLGLDHPEGASARQRSPMFTKQEALVRAVMRDSGTSS
jgi:probable rRNA maturation factor